MNIGKDTLLTLAMVVLFAACAWAGTDDKKTEAAPLHVPLIATKLADQISVDGKLDEPFWEKALQIELPFEHSPGENIPAIERTVVYLFYTKTHLVVGFKAYDSDPAKIRANISERDFDNDDDFVAIVLDTFNDQKRSYDFVANPHGVQVDLIEHRNGSDLGWDAIWDSAGFIADWGYSVEMLIPFSSFSFQAGDGEQIWGFDAIRSFPRSVVHRFGAFPRDRNNSCYLCQAIKITGFKDVEPGNSIELTPTFTSLYQQERENMPDGDFVEAEQNNEVGITGSWGITNNVNVGATINPDFSQVEADAAQLSINRAYAIYFEEKRPFFLEGSDFFSTRADLVYTRTMADPVWGTRVTGKQDEHTFGAYLVEDNITNLLFPGKTGSQTTSLDQKNTSSVLRYKYDYGKRSTIGAMYTGREGNNYHNRVLSLDGHHWLTESDFIRYQVVTSDTQYPDKIASEFDQDKDSFDGQYTEFLFVHAEREYNLYALYRTISAGFRADLGFNTKADWKVYVVGGDYNIYADSDTWWNEIGFNTELTYFEDQDGKKLHNIYTFNAYVQGDYQSLVRFFGSWGKQFYDEHYFSANEYSILARCTPVGSLDIGMVVEFGDQVDYAHSRSGSRFNVSPFTEFLLFQQFEVEATFTYERMAVDQGELYTATVFETILKYQFSTRAAIKGHLKYMSYQFNTDLYLDDQEPEYRDLYTQLLFSYKINPRTVFFLGYTDNYEGNHIYDITRKDRTLFTKLGYSWNP